MKIAHVLSGLTKGGAERVMAELANEAVKNGDLVTILAGWPEDPAFLQDKIHPSVEIKFISPKQKNSYFRIIGWILRNRKWLCSQDVLHCHMTFGAVFGTATYVLLKKILRNKTPAVVETYHGVGMSIPKFKRSLQATMSTFRDGLILMARDAYWDNFILKHPSLKSIIIRNGISVLNASASNIPKDQFLINAGIPATSKYLIGSVSVLRPDRHPADYIPLFAEILKTMGNDAHFVLGGNGIDSDKIANLVKEYNLLSNFHMIGLVNNPVPVFINLDVYVSISVGETAGISMIEAAMCGTPVVSIQLTEGYQAKKEDWVWSHTDIKEVAKRIIFLLQNIEERNKLSNQQQQYVNSNFTSEAMFRSYNSFYKEILNGTKK